MRENHERQVSLSDTPRCSAVLAGVTRLAPILLPPPPLDYPVGWFLCGVGDFAGGFDPRRGKLPRIDQADLRKYGGLVPVDTLTSDLSVFKLHNHDNGNFDPFARGRYTGEDPRHLDRVGKLVNQFIYYAVVPDRASYRHN